jgi:hypothetical protein
MQALQQVGLFLHSKFLYCKVQKVLELMAHPLRIRGIMVACLAKLLRI